MKNYTQSQIEKAQKRYNAFLVIRSIESFSPEFIGTLEAERRCYDHNALVNAIKGGNKQLEREWKMFFLNDEVKRDRKITERKAKQSANKEASADILAPIKAMRKLGEFGKWLNTPGNVYRKQHFSKKYTAEAVTSFLATI